MSKYVGSAILIFLLSLIRPYLFLCFSYSYSNVSCCRYSFFNPEPFSTSTRHCNCFISSDSSIAHPSLSSFLFCARFFPAFYHIYCFYNLATGVLYSGSPPLSCSCSLPPCLCIPAPPLSFFPSPTYPFFLSFILISNILYNFHLHILKKRIDFLLYMKNSMME